IEAYYDTEANRLVFVEDNIRTEDRAKQLFFHEATHGNLAYLETTEKGKKELSQILNSARDQLMAMADDLAAQTGFESLDQLKLAYDFQDETELLSELLARYSESLVYAPEPSWFSKLMTDLILWLKRNLNVSFNEDDIRNWLAGRMQRAAEGERLAEISTPQLAVGPASIVRKLTASVDPMETRALRRALQGVPEDVAKLLRARTYIPDENPENLRKANEFVDNNKLGDDVYRAKLAAKDQGLKGPVNILVYGVIGKRLKDAIFAIDQRIKAEGNSPELAALREKYSSELYEVLSDAQDILSETGQDLQAARVFANLFSPEEMVRVYTKPIRDVQKKLLEANEEVQRLKALIKTLKEELAAESLKRGIRVAVPETPETKFYEFLSLFGDMEPLENETFGEYLKRLGIDYSALLTELEKPITASVDPKTNENPISGNFRDLDAREAIRRLVGIDKNFFSKLVALRVRTGTFATSEQVGQTQEAKRKSKVSKENRAIELQMVFDFFNTTEASTPATEEPIEKDSLPVMARLAKYAADAVTD
ncbi:MAG: hypothetical protein EBT48_06630, partial [Verrucomicrobia bacterium]|nr:hypothetical protein [Verrucomicrobiota bacterium]